MFRSVSSKLLESLALTPALSEISFHRVVKSNSKTSRVQTEQYVPTVPNAVLKFLIDNSDISSADFLDNLCLCAETNQVCGITT